MYLSFRANGLSLVSRLALVFTGVASMVQVAPVHADVIVVNDTFDTPSGTATRIDDAADPLDVAWWNYGSGTVSHSVDNGSPGIGNDNTIQLEGNSPKIVANFSDVTLVNIGDWVELSFNLREVSSDATGSVRFGLFNNNPDSSVDSVVDADFQATRTTNDIGYWVILEPADGFVGTKDGSTFFGGSTLDFSTEGDLSNTPLAVLFRITKENATQARLSVSFDGSEVVTGLDANINTATFNEIAFFQTSGTDLLLDDIQVNTNIPEPATLGLMGLGGLLMVRRSK